MQNNKKNSEKKRDASDSFAGSCDTCAYLTYDEEYEEYVCDTYMDEDDVARLYGDKHYTCPYYKNGDEYRVVRHQM